jgi:hypothetical protein
MTVSSFLHAVNCSLLSPTPCLPDNHLVFLFFHHRSFSFSFSSLALSLSLGFILVLPPFSRIFFFILPCYLFTKWECNTLDALTFSFIRGKIRTSHRARALSRDLCFQFMRFFFIDLFLLFYSRFVVFMHEFDTLTSSSPQNNGR